MRRQLNELLLLSAASAPGSPLQLTRLVPAIAGKVFELMAILVKRLELLALALLFEVWVEHLLGVELSDAVDLASHRPLQDNWTRLLRLFQLVAVA